MRIDTESSGSVKDWRHTPNLTPRDHEIKRDEVYVVNGDTLIKAYHLLMNQRAASLITLSHISPMDIANYEQTLSFSKYINVVLFHLLHSTPLIDVLQAHEESLKEQDAPKHAGLTLKEILEKFHLRVGNKDELKPPKPPRGDIGDTNEKTDA